jgi:hypothetical protein
VSKETIAAVSVQHGPEDASETELSTLELAPLRRLIAGDATPALEFAHTLAAGLRGTRGDDARRTMLSSALAAERALQTLLQAMLADRLSRADSRGAAAIGAALDSCARRVERLAAAHRAESRGTATPVVMVAAAHVKIGGG